MSESLKPGDLAIVIKTPTGLSVGKIVTCERIEYPDTKYGVLWLVRSSRSDLTDLGGHVSDTALMPQDWLRKIPADPLPDEEENLELSRVLEDNLV